MTITLLKIVLNKPNQVYFTGEVIIGTVNLKLTERLRIKSVRVSAIGYGQVQWLASVLFNKPEFKFYNFLLT